jgi:hypothetical protein
MRNRPWVYVRELRIPLQTIVILFYITYMTNINSKDKIYAYVKYLIAKGFPNSFDARSWRWTRWSYSNERAFYRPHSICRP